MSMNLFTIGYEGLSFDSFLKYLIKFNINIVFDVRENPFSRKRGFSKSDLYKKLNLGRIQYIHLPQLGTPKSLRCELQIKRDYVHFFERYNTFLEDRIGYLNQILDILETKNVALMCYEREASKCHRSAIALKIKERSNNGIVIRNIRTS
ncbi:MAG: DUF488 domain-containing protein [Thermodesulfobacteriota bacterium]